VWVINASRYQNEFILQLRNRENIYIPFARLTTTSQPLVNLPKTWCQFPNGKIKILRNKLEVKVELTQFVLAELASTAVLPTYEKCFLPDHPKNSASDEKIQPLTKKFGRTHSPFYRS
jgi:hypothetical protein